MSQPGIRIKAMVGVCCACLLAIGMSSLLSDPPAAFGEPANELASKTEKEELSVSEKKSDRIIPPPLKDLGRNYKVRLIYFVPKDKKVKDRYQEKIESAMRVVADLYRRDLKSKGHDTRGMDFEFDEDGKLKVHLVNGDHPAEFYTGSPPTNDRLFHSTTDEMVAKIGYPMRRACLIFSEAGGIAEATPAYPYCGVAMVSANMLRDEIAATTIEQQIDNLFDETPVNKSDNKIEPRNREIQTSNGVLLHELGHIFYMLHDARDPRYIMFYGYRDLRKMFDRRFADEHPVRFSEEHARMAAATRYFAESCNELDGEAPVIEFKFTKPPQAGDTELHYSLKASDNEGLKAVIYFENTLEALSGGEALEGKSVDIKGTLVRQHVDKNMATRRVPLKAGQLIFHRIYLIDANGNVGTEENSYRVPDKGPSPSSRSE